jgi:hypothetical protein
MVRSLRVKVGVFANGQKLQYLNTVELPALFGQCGQKGGGLADSGVLPHRAWYISRAFCMVSSHG